MGKQRKHNKKSIKLHGEHVQLINKSGNLRGEPNQLRADSDSTAVKKTMRRADVLVAKT